jgi:hypothetical protein
MKRTIIGLVAIALAAPMAASAHNIPKRDYRNARDANIMAPFSASSWLRAHGVTRAPMVAGDGDATASICAAFTCRPSNDGDVTLMDVGGKCRGVGKAYHGRFADFNCVALLVERNEWSTDPHNTSVHTYSHGDVSMYKFRLHALGDLAWTATNVVKLREGW